MNDEQKKFLAELDKRLAIQEERHKQTMLSYTDIKIDIREVFTKLDSLSCSKHTAQINSLEEAIESNRRIYIVGLIIMIIGIIASKFI